MLIHGTGSGTCQWAAQMAKLRGFKVIGTCSKSKESIARATGVDELIVYDEAGGSLRKYPSTEVESIPPPPRGAIENKHWTDVVF